MELLTVFRLLLRRRRLLALGALAAIGCGVAATGTLGIGPFDGATRHSWIATSEVQVDTPRPLVADTAASATTIQTQTILLADHLTTDASREAIARGAGVPSVVVTVSTLAIDAPIRQSPLVIRGGEAAAVPRTPYTVTATPAVLSPLMALEASGPDRRTTAELSRAAVTVLRAAAVANAPTPTSQLVIEQLGPVHVESRESGGVGIALGVAVATFLLLGWCGAIVLASGIARAWQRIPDGTAAATP